MLLTISRLVTTSPKVQLKRTTVRPILQLFTESPTLKMERKNLAGLTLSDGPMMELLTILSCCTPVTMSQRALLRKTMEKLTPQSFTVRPISPTARKSPDGLTPSAGKMTDLMMTPSSSD